MAAGGVVLEVDKELIATDWIDACQLRLQRRAEETNKTYDLGGCETVENLAYEEQWLEGLAKERRTVTRE
jgi:hypothetical protein